MPQPRQLQMLVADDSAVCRAIFRDFVTRSGLPIKLVEARDGTECLEKIMRQRFDVAFLDVRMPGITGIEALSKIRERGDQTFTVIISSKPRDDVVAFARKLRAYDFLAKPFSTDAIQAVLDNYARVSKPMSVLVVDDSATVRKIVVKVLTHSVFRITCEEVETGEEAYDRTMNSDYDLLFLDFNLPGMNGVETLMKIREKKPEVKIILTSTDPEAKVRSHLRDVTLDVFLPKPFYPQDLDIAIHNVFGLKPTYQL